jgi:hypothetical protein
MADQSSWEQANIRQKLGLVWRNRKKISQIIKDYFYLPFFLLIILCFQVTKARVICMKISALKNKERVKKIFYLRGIN